MSVDDRVDVKTPEEERSQSFLSKIGWMTKLLGIVLILMFWYAASLTKEVPNLTYTNVTDLTTNITTTTPQLRYDSSAMVPREPLSPTYSLFMTVLFILIVIMLVNVERKPQDIITIREAQSIVQKHITAWQREEKLPPGKVYIKPNSFKLLHRVTSEQSLPFKYVMDVVLQNAQNGIKEYYIAEVNAKTKYFIGLIRAPAHLEREDTCGRCGKYADIKILNADAFKEYIKIKRDFSGVGR